MKIGIDISQLAYQSTGVAGYLENLIKTLIRNDQDNDYILFFSSFRNSIKPSVLSLRSDRVKIREFKYPPTLLNFFWNKLHILPIESFIGEVDVFITSDWTEPPTRRAKKATILYDLIVYKHPEETDRKIIETQKRKLEWVKKESDIIFCISESTAKDAEELLGLDRKKIKIAYPGIN